MSISQIHNNYEKAEKAAYLFMKSNKKFQSISKHTKELKNKVGGVSPFWILMSLMGIPLGIVFAIYESNMAQQAILTLLDPLGAGNVNKMMVSAIGAGLAIFAMFLGHIFGEGLHTIETDETTGRQNRTPFYLSIVGLVGYIVFQYYLVQAAGEGQEQFASFAIIAIGVAILEILVGVLILGKSITYLILFFNTLYLWVISMLMGKNARKTSKSYRLYRSNILLWNSENPTAKIELEGNENIRLSIAYYSGIELENNDNTKLYKIKYDIDERLN